MPRSSVTEILVGPEVLDSLASATSQRLKLLFKKWMGGIWLAEQSEWIMPHRGLQERELVGAHVVVVDIVPQVFIVMVETMVEIVTLMVAVDLVETVNGDEYEDIML
jgi:uncharacterized metal-binding protein